MVLSMMYNYWCPECFKENKTYTLQYDPKHGLYYCNVCGYVRSKGWSTYHRSKRFHYFDHGKTLCGVEAKPRQLTNDFSRKHWKPCKKCESIIKHRKRKK
ncbi:hypothetical protein GF326_08060 [Candidatus Bathyarchaeota archaeon]|nr:hypothetical protein [Candidatus Bathyarchaeota archaeon]